jgi:RNA polymerase sigma factor (sigma-70 family)
LGRTSSDEQGSAAGVVALEERRLLPRHRRGDPRAFAELVARYRAPVYGYLVRCGVPPGVRDDLFQETFAKVHAAAATYQPDRPLKPWLFTIVANLVRTHYRTRRVDALVFGEPAATAPSTTHADLEAKETGAWLEAAIAALPLAQREVVVLACIEHLEMKEIAVALDLPVGTVKTHLRRARLGLGRALAARKVRIAREAREPGT